MRPDESFVVQPIRSLQTMLRVIAEADGSLPSVVPDGFYGANTTAAVSAFQRRHGLAVTGIADQATWDAIVPIYEDALIEVTEAQPLYIILEPGEILKQGSQNPNIYLLQAILAVLAQSYNSIPRPGLTGILDLPTSESLSAFQTLSRLPATGELDKKTWKHLTQHYSLAGGLSQK